MVVVHPAMGRLWVWVWACLFVVGFAREARADDAGFLPVRVCVRPPEVPATVWGWGYPSGGPVLPLLRRKPWTRERFLEASYPFPIYLFDPDAPAAHTKQLPLPYRKLPVFIPGTIEGGGAFFGFPKPQSAQATKGGMFPNQLPERLAGELADAVKVGAKPISAGTPAFEAAVNSGTIKWVVTESGELLVTPKFIKGTEISHAVLSGGKPVLAAGEAEVAVAGGKALGMAISTHSGHFKPSPESVKIGVEAFRRAGIIF